MEVDEEMQQEQDFDETVDENLYLDELYKRYPGPGAFLHRQERVYARSIKVNNSICCVWLSYETDIDGCVVELKRVSSVELPIRHITLCPYGAASLFPVKNLLKKHVLLCQYSTNALYNFNNSFAMQLFYENGWEGCLGLIPDEGLRCVQMSKDVIRLLTLNAFQDMRMKFAHNLAKLGCQGVAIRTLQKNDLHDLKKVFVLPDDLGAVLGALDDAVEVARVNTFRPILFCFRFGDKMRRGLSLDMFCRESVTKVTVHAAVDIESQVPDISLLWSMTGLQQVIGTRGTLGACLSLTDCGTFQSNLDGKALDVKATLRGVCTYPEKLQFVQLYATTPHLSPKTRFHPVSGAIAGGLCFPPNMAAAFVRDAEKYINIMEQNLDLLRQSSCRLEVVVELPNVGSRVECESCLDFLGLERLLCTQAMLVPIPRESFSRIREIGLWLCRELKELLLHFKKTGNIGATWRSFQYELALEKLVWGRPLCPQSFGYSVNLGPGMLGPSRSLSDQRGFLALEAATACMQFENSIPNTRIWTSSKIISNSIQRAVGVHDHLDASYPVIGRLLVLALLKDLYDTGKVAAYCRFEDFLSGLTAEDSRFKIEGAISYLNLVHLLSLKRRIALPMVFGSLCAMVNNHKLPLQTVVEAGVVELELKQFPAVQTQDVHGNSILKWNIRNSFWRIVCYISTESPSCPEVFSQLARGELERRRLIFPSRLKKLPSVWPWIAPCLSRISRERLNEEETVTTLAFVSAVAFQMQGWFVDFECFSALLADLPLSQFRLRNLEIQSKLELANFRFEGLKVYRLHERIPHRIQAEKVSKEHEERVVDEDPVETVLEEGEVQRIGEEAQPTDSPQIVGDRRDPVCAEVGVFRRIWTGPELEILQQVVQSSKPGASIYERFSKYRTLCMQNDIPFRTLLAFKAKLFRLVPVETA